MDSMTSASGPGELGAFLRARRARMAPQDFGLPETDSRRKVGGLRREEVAALAAISVDYYTRLEQGRVRASATVLATLARALRLDEDQQRYLDELAGKADARPRRRRPVQRVRPAMRRLVDQLTATPAVVLGKRLDILEWNSAAAALYTDFSLIPADRRNYVRLLFTHSVIRGMHREWEHDSRDAVAALRMEAAADPDDRARPAHRRAVGPGRRVPHLVGRASRHQLQPRHQALPSSAGRRSGLDCDMWSNPDGSGQRLMVLTAEPGSPSHDALRILTSWTAGQADANLVEGRS